MNGSKNTVSPPDLTTPLRGITALQQVIDVVIPLCLVVMVFGMTRITDDTKKAISTMEMILSAGITVLALLGALARWFGDAMQGKLAGLESAVPGEAAVSDAGAAARRALAGYEARRWCRWGSRGRLVLCYVVAGMVCSFVAFMWSKP